MDVGSNLFASASAEAVRGSRGSSFLSRTLFPLFSFGVPVKMPPSCPPTSALGCPLLNSSLNLPSSSTTFFPKMSGNPSPQKSGALHLRPGRGGRCEALCMWVAASASPQTATASVDQRCLSQLSRSSLSAQGLKGATSRMSVRAKQACEAGLSLSHWTQRRGESKRRFRPLPARTLSAHWNPEIEES